MKLTSLTYLLKTLKETEKLSSKPFDQWPTCAATLSKCTEEEGNRVYQCQELKHFSEAVRLYTSRCEDYCRWVSQCIKSHASWSDLDLACDVIFMLSTHGWEKALEENNDMAAINRLVERFAIPLQGAQANTDAIVTEFREMISYAMQYFDLSVLEYHSVWWKLFHAPNSADWANALLSASIQWEAGPDIFHCWHDQSRQALSTDK